MVVLNLSFRWARRWSLVGLWKNVCALGAVLSLLVSSLSSGAVMLMR